MRLFLYILDLNEGMPDYIVFKAENEPKEVTVLKSLEAHYKDVVYVDDWYEIKEHQLRVLDCLVIEL